MLHARFGSFALARRASLAVAAFVEFAAVASATDWYVDRSYYACFSSDGSPGRPYCSIKAALAVAQSGDTIHVAPGTYHEDNDLNVDLTLIGTNGAAATILDAAPSIVRVNGVKASISGFTIQNSSSSGIRASSRATLSISDCIVTRNAGANRQVGGGLRCIQACDVTISRTTFSLNGINSPGGGGVYVSGGTCAIIDCIFDANDSEGLFAENGATLAIQSTTFQNHKTGAAAHLSNVWTAISGCTFVNNVVASEGGALLLDWTGYTDIEDSTFDSNGADKGGAIRIDGADLACERCTFHANTATGSGFYGGDGGAIYASYSWSFILSDCLFDSNVAASPSLGPTGSGGLTLIYGSAWLVRCRFVGNVSNECYGLGAGALSAQGSLSAFDCEFTGNRGVAVYFSGGPGAIYASDGNTFTRCTIAGNTSDTTGGGIRCDSFGNVFFFHCVIAGNFAGTGGAPDVDGVVNSQGWNDIGDTTGTTIVGGSNDLLDVDPLFVDPSNGDFSLQSISPCVDSGDPTAIPSGPDVGSNPRLLDGNLDGILVLDRGAREFDNVHLDVSGTPTPGGSLTLTSSGTSGLSLLLLAGAAPGELFVNPFGALFIDLTQPFLIVPFGTIPNSQTFTLAPSFPAPVSFWLQEAAIGVGAGNLSNVVEVDVK
jgi:parallel beta helix pectate lyase-like protein